MRVEKNWLEWVVFALGAVLALAAIGYLAVDAFQVGDGHPRIQVDFGQPQITGTSTRIPIVVRNLGDETAGQVQVRVRVVRGGAFAEEVDLSLPFLPRHSERQAEVVLTSPLGPDDRLLVAGIGYERP